MKREDDFDSRRGHLAALSDESRELVKITTIATGLVGFYLIWASVFPALLIFDDINLWYYNTNFATFVNPAQNLLVPAGGDLKLSFPAEERGPPESL